MIELSTPPLTAALLCALALCATDAAFAFDGEEALAGSEASERAREADRLYQIGLLQFEGREFEAAARNFLKAFELDPNPVLAYNVARARENNGDLDLARTYYERALTLNPPDDVKARSESALIRLRKGEENIRDKLESEKPTTGTVSINIQGGGLLFVDGARRGNAPAELALKEGPHNLEIRRQGHEPFIKQVDVVAGTQLVIDASLEERFEVPSWVAWGGGVALVGGVALAGGGAFFALDAQEAFDEAQSLEAQRDRTLFDDLRTRGESSQATSTGLYAAGGALAVVGVGLLVLYTISPEESLESLERASVQIGPTSMLVSVPF